MYQKIKNDQSFESIKKKKKKRYIYCLSFNSLLKSHFLVPFLKDYRNNHFKFFSKNM